MNYEWSFIKSRVNVIEVLIIKKLLNELFHLSYSGKTCVGSEYVDLLDGSLGMLQLDEFMNALLDKFKVQPNLDIRTKVLDPNVLGIQKWMFHWALTNSIKPEVHLQTTFTRVKTEVF